MAAKGTPLPSALRSSITPAQWRALSPSVQRDLARQSRQVSQKARETAKQHAPKVKSRDPKNVKARAKRFADKPLSKRGDYWHKIDARHEPREFWDYYLDAS